jgi:hypothetical protein
MIVPGAGSLPGKSVSATNCDGMVAFRVRYWDAIVCSRVGSFSAAHSTFRIAVLSCAALVARKVRPISASITVVRCLME